MKRSLDEPENTDVENFSKNKKRLVDHSFMKWFAKRVVCIANEQVEQTKDIFEYEKNHHSFWDFDKYKTFHRCQTCWKMQTQETKFSGCWHKERMCLNRTCGDCKCFCKDCKKHFCHEHYSKHPCLIDKQTMIVLGDMFRTLALYMVVRFYVLTSRDKNVGNVFHKRKCGYCFRVQVSTDPNFEQECNIAGYKQKITGNKCSHCSSFSAN